MKKICLFLLIIFVFLSALPVSATEETAELNNKVSCYSLDAINTVLGKEEIIENADSILIYEKSSSTLMYAWNADEQGYPASLVKIMTGLIVAQQGNMSEAVTVKESALSQIPSDAATVGLQPDEVIPLQDLFYCMMVSSANDAAAVLADHLAGSQEAFVEQMNEYARELGCTGTNFTNVHGLHDEMQKTTVRDMAKVLNVALDNELFRKAFGTERYTVEPTNKSKVRYLVTGNYLMSMDDVVYYYDERVTGGRTGVTTEGYRNIAVSAKVGPMELICILTGAESELAANGYVEVFGGYTEVRDLLDICFEDYKVSHVIYDDQVLTQMPVSGGECDVVLGPKTNVLAVLPSNARTSDLTYRYPVNSAALNAPISKGDSISSVEVWHKTICVGQAELFALNDVDPQQVATVDVEQKGSDGNLTALWVILGIVAGVVIIVFAFRVINTARIRRRRKNRRRSR